MKYSSHVANKYAKLYEDHPDDRSLWLERLRSALMGIALRRPFGLTTDAWYSQDPDVKQAVKDIRELMAQIESETESAI